MMVRKTRSGWVIERTDTVNGCLKQGGVSGREELYKHETLKRAGVAYAADPASLLNEHGLTAEQYLLERVNPDRILRRGHIVQ